MKRQDQKSLKNKLRSLYRRKRLAPPYQKELIHREIVRTKKLLTDVYGDDAKKNSAFSSFLGLVFGIGFLIALPILTSDRTMMDNRDAQKLL
jgi:hypothetical protein